AAAVQDQEWSTPQPLTEAQWKPAGERLTQLAEMTKAEGVTLVLHPHAGTLVETAEDVHHALAYTDVPWCLDTGHLAIGGVDPAQFVKNHADRIGHVHLKDVDTAVANRFNSKELTLVQAVQEGLFKALGDGDAR